MKKQLTNSNWLKEIKKGLELSPLQREVLIGTILGDGSFKRSRSGKAACLQICHSVKVREYVDWKRKIFANWVFADPKYHESNRALIFRTVSHSAIFEYMKMFYNGKIKIVPQNISELLKSNLSLAVWFMDDGNGYLESYALRISTYSFGLEGNLLLKDCLGRNFSINAHIKRDSKGYQMYIPTRDGSAAKLKNLIAPFTIPCMQYKINRRSPVETNIGGTRYSGI